MNKSRYHIWLNIVLFLLTVFGINVVLYIPVVIVFPDALDKTHGLDDDVLLTIIGQSTFLISSIFALFLFRHSIEKRNIIIKVDIAGFIKGGFIAFSLIGSAFALMLGFNFIDVTLVKNDKILPQVILFFLIACSEEIVCRGYILDRLQFTMKPIYAIILSSLIFGMFHFFNDSFGWVGLINISLSGVLMSMLYIKAGNLSAPIGMHFIWNLIQGPLLGFGVSGFKETSFTEIHYNSANEIVTGGEFGLEGSILLVPLSIAAIIILHMATRKSLNRTAYT